MQKIPPFWTATMQDSKVPKICERNCMMINPSLLIHVPKRVLSLPTYSGVRDTVSFRILVNILAGEA